MMLAFSRSKVVGVEHLKEDVFLAHGVLDDNIYAMDVDVEIKFPDAEITTVSGRMKRITTPYCELAIPKLQNAVGLHLNEDDFARKVSRVVGREGCTHFANLLLECCDAVMQAAIYDEWQTLKEKGITPNKQDFLNDRLQHIPGLRDSCMVYSSKVS